MKKTDLIVKLLLYDIADKVLTGELPGELMKTKHNFVLLQYSLTYTNGTANQHLHEHQEDKPYVYIY